MTPRADSVRAAHPLFQAEGGGSTPTSALQLRLVEIDAKLASRLNALWHSRLPRIPWSNIVRNRYSLCYGAVFGGLYYAVAIWSSPVAGPHAFPIESTLELRRLAIGQDAPPNTASRLLGVMARLIRSRLPLVARLISYQDLEVHAGTIYKAAGWTPLFTGERSHWHSPSRERLLPVAPKPKIRWEKVIR